MKVMGRLDLVVSNHGWTKIRDFANLDDNMEESDWDLCYNMNVKSHLWLFHAARKYLEESEGSFVTTASVAGVIPGGSSMVCGSIRNRPRFRDFRFNMFNVDLYRRILLRKLLKFTL